MEEKICRVYHVSRGKSHQYMGQSYQTKTHFPIWHEVHMLVLICLSQKLPNGVRVGTCISKKIRSNLDPFHHPYAILLKGVTNPVPATSLCWQRGSLL